MVRTFMGRRVIMTTLDPVPRGMRAVPGFIVLNHREFAALGNDDDRVVEEIAEICIAETMADAKGVYNVDRKRKVK